MDIYFPVEWRFGDKPTDGAGGPPVDDAGTIYIVRDEENPDDWPDDDADIVVKKTTLTELMNISLDGWANQTRKTDEVHVPASKALAAALRAAADQLDAGLPS